VPADALPELAPSDVTPEEDEVFEEPSGPLVVPTGAPPVSLEASGEPVDPYLHEGAAVVRAGVVRGAPRAHQGADAEVPSIVVDPVLSDRHREPPSAARPSTAPIASRAEPLRPSSAPSPPPDEPARRSLLPSVREAAEASWTPLAVAFVAGMLAGAALVLAILRL
jgi:hypothetical protein